MRNIIATLLLFVGLVSAQAPTPRAVEVLRQFDKLAQKPLWPGFEPQKIAVELYDGSNTYLYHHPKPPEGFQPVPGAPGVFVFPGQHDSVRANTGTELNGVPTATADISKDTRPPREVASLLIHESFHVYEKQAHPKWAANEAELFTYPFDNAEALARRRMETQALVRALAAKNDREVRCWTEAALKARQERFDKMSSGAAGYERGIELNEGLAQYVEYKSIDKPPALTASDFPLELIRQRGYATGQAFGLVLDRSDKGWQSELGTKPGLDGYRTDSLDELLGYRFGIAASRPPKPCVLPEKDQKAEHERAQREVAGLVATRAQRKQEFLAAPGWRLEIVAGKEPLWPQGFDPWNVANLGDNDILHTRWVKLGNGSGSLEVLSHASMTEGVGPHPLFNGAKRLIVTGLAEPKVTEASGKVTIDVAGAKGTLAGTVERSGQTVVVRLPD